MKKDKKPVKWRSVKELAKEGKCVIRLELDGEAIDNIIAIAKKLPGYADMHPRTIQRLLLEKLGLFNEADRIIKEILLSPPRQEK